MKQLLTKLFRGANAEQEFYDETLERLADILVSNYEVRLRSQARRIKDADYE